MKMSQDMGFIELTPTHSKRTHNEKSSRHHGHRSNKKNPQHKTSSKEIRPNDQDLGYFILEAAKKGNPEELESLLRDGVDPNVVDNFGRSPLHLSVSNGCSCSPCVQDAESCVILLLTSNSPTLNVNLQDEHGNTALHFAIYNQLSKCSEMLISYGADVTLLNESGENAVRLMSKKLPNSLLHLMNESIYVDQFDPHHDKCSIKLDFRPLIHTTTDRHKSKKVSKSKSNKSSESGSSSQGIHHGQGNDMKREMIFPMFLLETNQSNQSSSGEKLLTHSLLQIFLHLKWQRVKKLFWASFLAYMLWVILYTGYVLDVYVMSCPCEFYNLRPPPPVNSSSTIINAGAQEPSENRCKIATELNVEVVVIIISVIILLFIEIAKLVITPRMYFRSWQTLLNWLLIVLVFCTTIPNLTGQTVINPIQYQSAAFTVFLAWAFVLTEIARFPSLAKYVDIFAHVITCFGSFILTFASLIMGFALAFCILFPGENSPFANFSHSVLKVFVMMIGEVDYQDMFYRDDQVTGPVMGHLLYALFAILVCIILMNLFVGLTVSDIQALEKRAEYARLCRLVIEMYHVESAIFSKQLPRFIGKVLKSFISVNLPEYQYSFRPNQRPNGNSLPRNLSRTAVQLAEATFNKSRSQRCSKGHDDNHDQDDVLQDTELVEMQSYLSHDPPSSVISTSQSSSPLETNSLDINDMGTRHDYLAHLRSWNSCVDHLRT